MLTTNGASISASGLGGLCILCDLTDVNNVLNSDTTDFANADITVGVAGYAYIRVALPTTYSANTRVGFGVEVNGGIASLLEGITIYARNNGVVVGTASGSGLLSLLDLGGDFGEVSAVFCTDFDEIEIEMGALVGLTANYKVYYSYITEGCSFPVQCGATATTEVCGDNIDNDGNGFVDFEEPSIDCDGDGFSNDSDSDPADPCIPVQGIGYTGYDPANTTWQMADCDSDGINNGQEIADGTDPYDGTDFIPPCDAGTAAPILIRN